MFLNLIDRLLSKNKFVLSSPSIPQLFRLMFLPRLFIAFLPLICNHIPLCSLLHCLLFLTNMHHLKSFLVPRDQMNHLLLLKFFVKKLNVPNLNQFIAAVKPNKIRSISKINPNLSPSLSLPPNDLSTGHELISTRITLRNSGQL